MNFVKTLKCYLCFTISSLPEENFPEDLYDLITHYSIDQLLWLCKVCKNDLDRKTTTSFLFGKQNEIKDLKYIKGLERLQSTVTPDFEKSCTKYHSQDSFSSSVEDVVDSGSEAGTVQSLKTLSLSENPKGNKTARKYVQEVLNKIKITREEEAMNKQIIIPVLDILLKDLKRDEAFLSVFNRFYYTGSAYNDLRIIAATEYDINVVLHLPGSVSLIPDFFDENFSFGKLKWESSDRNIPDFVIKFLEQNSVENCLQPQLVLSWFQRHIDLSLQRIHTYTSKVQSVKTSSAGPARTLVINTTLGYSISIDLVPVFEFGCSTLCGTPVLEEIMKINEDENKNSWFMVPKPCQGEIENISLTDSKLSWRIDFPNSEKHILYRKECAKNVIKILKILRDKRNWKNLASHYLKMVILLEIKKNPSAHHWMNGCVFERILDALKQLKMYLKNQNLPHFLSNQNLLFRLKDSECINYSNYLNNIIPEVESKPEKLVELLE